MKYLWYLLVSKLKYIVVLDIQRFECYGMLHKLFWIMIRIHWKHHVLSSLMRRRKILELIFWLMWFLDLWWLIFEDIFCLTFGKGFHRFRVDNGDEAFLHFLLDVFTKILEIIFSFFRNNGNVLMKCWGIRQIFHNSFCCLSILYLVFKGKISCS